MKKFEQTNPLENERLIYNTNEKKKITKSKKQLNSFVRIDEDNYKKQDL